MLAHHAAELGFGELGLDLFLPGDIAALAIEANEEELEVLLIAGVAPFAPLAEPALAESAHPLGDAGAIARVTGEEDLVAGDDGARRAGAGELDLPEDAVLGDLRGEILVVRHAAAHPAKARPIGREERTQTEGESGEHETQTR